MGGVSEVGGDERLEPGEKIKPIKQELKKKITERLGILYWEDG